MMLVLDNFLGMMPMVDTPDLPETNAAESMDCWFVNGTLQPIRFDSVAGTVQQLFSTNPVTLFRYRPCPTNPADAHWLTQDVDYNVTTSPIANDAYARLFATRRDGAWPPGFAPVSLLLNRTTPCGVGDRQAGSLFDVEALGLNRPTLNMDEWIGVLTYDIQRSYVATVVDTYGRESAPSDPQALWLDSAIPNPSVSGVVSFDQTPSDGSVAIAAIRLYRTNTTGAGTEFQFVNETPVSPPRTSATSFPLVVDTVLDGELAEVLPSVSWTAPPATLRGLVSAPGGVLAGFVDNAVWFSEPGQPHAWPTEYQRIVDYPVVGLVAFGNSLLIATTGQPYVASGVDPANMAITKLDINHPCASAKSIVSMGDRAVYASPYGLVSVSESGVEWMTRQLFTKDQWLAYNPSSMIGVPWEGRYLCFFTPTGTIVPAGARALAMIPGLEAEGVTFFSTSAQAVFFDPYDASTYYINTTAPYAVYKFNGNTTTRQATWKSKLFETPQYVRWSWCHVQVTPATTAFPVRIQMYQDYRTTPSFELVITGYDLASKRASYQLLAYDSEGGVTSNTSSTALGMNFRLPMLPRARIHQVTVAVSAGAVRKIVFAQSVEELKNL